MNLVVGDPNPTLPEVVGKTCPAAGQDWAIGNPSPSASSPGATVAHGDGDTRVECMVAQDGAFRVTASGMDPGMLPPNSYIFLDVMGHAAPGAPVETTIYTVPTLEVASEPGYPPCSVMAVRAAGARALWASIDCPALTSPERPTVACHVSGEIVLEYCGE